MDPNQLRALCAFQLTETLKKHALSATSLQILMLASQNKWVDREYVMRKCDLSESSAGVYLHRLKERDLLVVKKRGQYYPTKECRRIIGEIT